MIAPIGVRAVGAGGILGAAREIWANQIFTKVSMFRFAFFFFERVIFFYFELMSASVKPVKFIFGLCVESSSEQLS